MGFSIKKVGKAVGKAVGVGVRTGLGFVTGGASEALLGKEKKGAGSVSDSAEQKLITEQAESRQKRRRLFETEGGASGQEVESVGLSGDVRGSIFGNRRA